MVAPGQMGVTSSPRYSAGGNSAYATPSVAQTPTSPVYNPTSPSYNHADPVYEPIQDDDEDEDDKCQ